MARIDDVDALVGGVEAFGVGVVGRSIAIERRKDESHAAGRLPFRSGPGNAEQVEGVGYSKRMLGCDMLGGGWMARFNNKRPPDGSNRVIRCAEVKCETLLTVKGR